MPGPNRTGTLILLIGGGLLVALMAYTLTLGGGPGGLPGPMRDAVEVAVFFPDADDWRDFAEGIALARERVGAREIRTEAASVTVVTPGQGRRVRFAWYDAGGVEQAREQVDRLMGSAHPPAAFVGSSNTLLTAALARALAEATRSNGKDGADAPVLLVPWATSVAVEGDRGAEGGRLLDLYPGRTFRFCADNRALATLVAECVSGRERGSAPGLVELVVDPRDPYSRDLADGFRRSLDRIAPDAAVTTREIGSNAPGSGRFADAAGLAERAVATAIGSALRSRSDDDRPTWIVLPLQGRPARRMLDGLGVQSVLVDAAGAGRLEVLSGDGLGVEDLREISSTSPFPVACVSSDLSVGSHDEAGLTSGVRVSAEIVVALLLALDQSPGGDARDRLRSLDLQADDPWALGRAIAFDATGERATADLGVVLAIDPAAKGVVSAMPRRGDATWEPPIALPPARPLTP